MGKCWLSRGIYTILEQLYHCFFFVFPSCIFDLDLLNLHNNKCSKSITVSVQATLRLRILLISLALFSTYIKYFAFMKACPSIVLDHIAKLSSLPTELCILIIENISCNSLFLNMNVIMQFNTLIFSDLWSIFWSSIIFLDVFNFLDILRPFLKCKLVCK